jgi:hypothetical protein
LSAVAALPTLAEVQGLDTAYLRAAAGYWTHTASTWERAFTDVYERVSAPTWQGYAAGAAVGVSYQDLVEVRGASFHLQDAAGVARRGEAQLRACRECVLEAIAEARADGFGVGDDYSVRDRSSGGSAAYRAAREAQARTHASFIRHRVAALVAADQQITAQITAATKGVDSLNFRQAPGVEDRNHHVQAVDHHWKLDPAPQGPTADDIRRVLEGLPEGTDPQIREVRSQEDLDRLWDWIREHGVPSWNRYRDPGKGGWVDLPDGTSVGRRGIANSTELPALDVSTPGEKGYYKVHINPQRGGVPGIPAPASPAPPKAPPPPAEPEPLFPRRPGLIGGGGGYSSTNLVPGLRLISPPHSRRGQHHLGEDPEDLREEAEE